MAPPSLGPTIHANALIIDAVAVIIRGRSGAGKSALTLDLLAASHEAGRFAALIGDDRVIVSALSGRLVVQAPPIIAGRIERRGTGIEAVRHEPAGVVALVVDLVDSAISRVPEPADLTAEIAGIHVPRLCLAEGGPPRSREVLAALDRLSAEPSRHQAEF
jgi:serine kinase of HPr protein (carbohydrate metabolism regulator)